MNKNIKIKERLAKATSRLFQYYSHVSRPSRLMEIHGKRVLSIVDQTPGSKEFMNFAGLVTSDITMLMRMNDETMLRSALANVKILQERGDNYGEMTNEEICSYIRPRNVQTLAEFDCWFKHVDGETIEKARAAMIDEMNKKKSDPKLK